MRERGRIEKVRVGNNFFSFGEKDAGGVGGGRRQLVQGVRAVSESGAWAERDVLQWLGWVGDGIGRGEVQVEVYSGSLVAWRRTAGVGRLCDAEVVQK